MPTQSAPIAVHHVSVTSSKPNFTTVSVCYHSLEPVKPSWTIDEGFTPFCMCMFMLSLFLSASLSVFKCSP